LEGHWKFRGGRKSQTLNLEFLEGGGGSIQKTFSGRIWIQIGLEQQTATLPGWYTRLLPVFFKVVLEWTVS